MTTTTTVDSTSFEAFKSSFASFKEAKASLNIKAVSWDKLFSIYTSSSIEVVEEICIPSDESFETVEPTIVIEENTMNTTTTSMITPVSTSDVAGTFVSVNKDLFSILSTHQVECKVVQPFAATCKRAAGKYFSFKVPASYEAGMYAPQAFMIEVEKYDVSMVELINRNIHVSGIKFDGMTAAQQFAYRIAYAMYANNIGFAKIYEGLLKGYKIFLHSSSMISQNTGKAYRQLSFNTSVKSVGPMGEGSTSKFVNPRIPCDSEFGQNVLVAGQAARLVFESSKKDGKLVASANKVVAREMKLGAGKTAGLTNIGTRSAILIDEALNPQGLSTLVKRMLVLGTAWVSSEEYLAYGSCRIVPVKAVTAPMPKAVMTLGRNEMVIGGNSHKSKLNGVLVKALGLTHLEVSKMTTAEAREALAGFECDVVVGGESFRAYRFNVSLMATNFYSLYSLEGCEDYVEEFEGESVAKGFFDAALKAVEQAAADGYYFDLKTHIEESIAAGEIKRKQRSVKITSAEVQQVAVSYGYESARQFVDALMTKGNVASKYFMFEKASDLPKVTRDELFDLFRDTIIGDVEPTLVPESFVLGFYDLIGNDSKGFCLSHKGFDFPFAPIGNVEFEDGYVKDVPASLVSLMVMGASLRNKNTDWSVKWTNHMVELNSQMLGKFQTMKTRGAYLAAVSGFWLNPTEVFSFGDDAGKVTSAKLPILFDQSITGLMNQNGSDTVYSPEELMAYESHFSRIAFVSPEYFLSQENDGDGDLVKIMRNFKSIPVWAGQPTFAKSKIAAYVRGEYEGLSLSLKPYAVMAFEEFDAGNFAAKVAKDNVAIMAANEYRVKASMAQFLESGVKDTQSLAAMVAEASAYLVQYEAMRAAKHDGAVSAFDGCKCSPSAKNVKNIQEYVSNWASLLKSYFGYNVSMKDEINLSMMLAEMFEGKYNRACPTDDVTKFVTTGAITVQGYSFAIQQKSFSRTIGSYVGAFKVVSDNDKKAEEKRAVNAAGVTLFKSVVSYNSCFSGVPALVARKINQDVIAAKGDIFAYFLSAVAAAYAVASAPVDPTDGTTVETSNEEVLAESVSTEVVVGVTVENVSQSTSVDSIAVWNTVLPTVLFVQNKTEASDLRLARLKRSIFVSCLEADSFESALAEAESFVCDYNDFAFEVDYSEELDEVLAVEANDSVQLASDNTPVQKSCVNTDKQKVKTTSQRVVVVSNASKLYENMVVAGRDPEDFSTGELRSMKYETRRASIEATVNGDKPSKSVNSGVVENGNTAFYSDYDAYAAFMSDNCG